MGNCIWETLIRIERKTALLTTMVCACVVKHDFMILK